VPIGAEARALRKPGSGGVSLPATFVAAGADFTIADYRHVANVSNESSAPMEQPTIHDAAAADAGAHGDIDEVLKWSAGAKLPFPKDGRDAVVLKPNRQADLGFNHLPEGNVYETRESRDRERNAAHGIDRPATIRQRR